MAHEIKENIVEQLIDAISMNEWLQEQCHHYAITMMRKDKLIPEGQDYLHEDNEFYDIYWALYTLQLSAYIAAIHKQFLNA